MNMYFCSKLLDDAVFITRVFTNAEQYPWKLQSYYSQKKVQMAQTIQVKWYII